MSQNPNDPPNLFDNLNNVNTCLGIITASFAILAFLGFATLRDIINIVWPQPEPTAESITHNTTFSQAILQVDNQVIYLHDNGLQSVACNSSHHLEIKLLAENGSVLPPEKFTYSWAFVPGDKYNQDKPLSANYAINYQVPCELNGQLVSLTVQQEQKTLFSKSISFNVAK